MTSPDLLITGGNVIDPASGLDQVVDVAVTDGRISGIGPDMARGGARRTIDARGHIVSPGLVDLHTHVLGGVIDMAVDPDEAGVLSGVTSVVDAGSAGPATIRAFFERVIPASRTTVLPFMHIAQTGLATRPDISAASDVDFDAVERSLSEYPGRIGGLKVRMVNPALRVLGIGMLERAVRIARDAHLPVMVHIGDLLQQSDRSLGPQTLDLLGEGDIVTHVFTPHPGGVLDDEGAVFPEVFEAARRGVLFDAAHGRRNLSFDVARRVLDQGVPLSAISTDMTRDGRSDVVYSMTEVMSRYLQLGFTVPEVISLTTSGPAHAAGLRNAGSLRIGAVADISVLELRGGSWNVQDADGEFMHLRQLFVPAHTVRRGETILPGSGPHAGGWEPDSAAGDTVRGAHDGQ